MSYALYVVTDEQLSNGRSHVEIAREALKGGADVIQLRDKTMPARMMVETGKDIRELTRRAGALFIVNDRVEVAMACGADGVHLGQDDLPASVVRSFVPEGFIIGVSVGSVEQARKAVADGADYIAISPLFSTGSKSDAGPGLGLGLLRSVAAEVEVPVVAIGGIGIDNAASVIEAGADGVAVISAVVSRPDIAAAARELKSVVMKALAGR